MAAFRILICRCRHFAFYRLPSELARAALTKKDPVGISDGVLFASYAAFRKLRINRSASSSASFSSSVISAMIFSRSSISSSLVILLLFRSFSCIFQQTCAFSAPHVAKRCYSIGGRPGWPCRRPAPGVCRRASRSPCCDCIVTDRREFRNRTLCGRAGVQLFRHEYIPVHP